ncbi:hypothetical protein Q604_UNBC07647G0001, partial [human gut metagenome]
QGNMTPRMKKLRAEIALGRETLDEFEDLLAAPVVFCCCVNCAGVHTSALPRRIVSVTEQ